MRGRSIGGGLCTAAGLLALITLVTTACTGDGPSGDLRSFDLRGEEYEGPRPDGPELSSDWGRSAAAVVEAPATVTAGDDLDVVVELRNPLVVPLDVDPCPVWSGGFGGDTSAINVTGRLPCSEIGEFQPGERIRLRLTVPSPSRVDFNEGGAYPTFNWRLEGSDRSASAGASIAIPMQEG